MVKKDKEGFNEAKDIKDAAKFTYQCLESGDDKDKFMTLGKVNLMTPWGKVAENEMELPFRVVYSEDRYMSEGGAPEKREHRSGNMVFHSSNYGPLFGSGNTAATWSDLKAAGSGW